MTPTTYINIHVPGHIKLSKVLKQQNLDSYQICSQSIGNDDCIHILLAKSIPERMQEMLGTFEPSISNTHYQAVSFMVDWQSGDILHITTTDFGVLKPNLYFIDRLEERFLLADVNSEYYENDTFDNNILITDHKGTVYTELCFGTGINQCMVDHSNRIITSYSDEGVYGNDGWQKPIGFCGLIVWSKTGERLWENQNHDIVDCYAINLDDDDNLWFYYYDDYPLKPTSYTFRGAKAILKDTKNNLYFVDWALAKV